MTTLNCLKPNIVYECVKESRSFKKNQFYVFETDGSLSCFGKNSGSYDADEVVAIILKENPAFKSSNRYCYLNGRVILMKPIDERITDQVLTSARDAINDRLAELNVKDANKRT